MVLESKVSDLCDRTRELLRCLESRHLDDDIGHTDLSKVTEAIEAAVKRLQSAEKQEKQKLEGKHSRSQKRRTFSLKTREKCPNNNNTVKDIDEMSDEARGIGVGPPLVQDEATGEKRSRRLRGRPRMSSGVGEWKNGHACRKCRKHFATAHMAATHYRNVHGDDVSGGVASGVGDEIMRRSVAETLPFYSCQLCYASYRLLEELASHRCPEGSSSSPPRPISDLGFLSSHNRFRCGLCLEELRRSSRMRAHLERCRGGTIRCELCGVEESTRKAMNDHKAKKHKKQLAFHCPECPKKFKLNTSLQRHLAVRHEKEKPSHRCDTCGKRFVKKVYLTNHQTRFHGLFKPYLCSVCGDRFVSEATLSSHAEIHAGLTRYDCEFCDKKFRRRDKLDFHLCSHTGERPHRCSRCPRTFVRKSKLQEHLRRHSGEKRFACLVCNRAYSGSMDLRKHLAKHHPSVGSRIRPNEPLTPQIIANINLGDNSSNLAAVANPVLASTSAASAVQASVAEDAFEAASGLSGLADMDDVAEEINVLESFVTDAAVLLDDELLK